MISVKWIILCQEAIIDKRTNNLSLINIMDEIVASDFPAAVISMKMVIGFSITDQPEKGYMKIELLGPEGRIRKTQGEVNFETGNARIIVDFDQTSFETPGEHKCRVSLRKTENSKWSRKGEAVLHIVSGRKE